MKKVGITMRTAPPDGPDCYGTDPEFVRLLLQHEEFTGTVWEPCCGTGLISEALIAAGYRVKSSDLHDYGYGSSGVDFLQ